ncbi:hypothetical protein BDF21DRAFT_400033 [Thamnidium elegans]|nr:hypothetical protein BDF21DRAFT_400033 [Thamnidium elegans]
MRLFIFIKAQLLAIRGIGTQFINHNIFPRLAFDTIQIRRSKGDLGIIDLSFGNSKFLYRLELFGTEPSTTKYQQNLYYIDYFLIKLHHTIASSVCPNAMSEETADHSLFICPPKKPIRFNIFTSYIFSTGTPSSISAFIPTILSLSLPTHFERDSTITPLPELNTYQIFACTLLHIGEPTGDSPLIALHLYPQTSLSPSPKL